MEDRRRLGRWPINRDGRGMRAALSLLVGLVLAGACVPPRPPETKPTVQAAAGGEEKEGEKEEGEKKEPFEPWEKVLKDTRAIEGVFTFHRKRDGTLLLEIDPNRLEEEFGMVLHYSRGVGDFNVQQGLPLSETRLMRFRRVGDRVQLLHLNSRFTAEPGSRIARAAARNTGNSVVAAWKIASEHDSTKHLLVDVTPWLLSDYPRVSDRLAPYYGGKPVTLDADRSYVGRVLGFPRNVEIDAELTYKAGSPPRFGGFGVSDFRSVPVGVRYSLFALPEQPMHARPGDDRVGYFLTAHWDFSRDREEVPFVRSINRWRLEKKDPDAELSEPVKPIVYYVDRSVPGPYRRYVKEGIEAWNKAFEAAGFQQAIVARDPPDDTTWSAEDLRYSTVRWTPSYNMGYAIGPSQVDPRTGEVLNADILVAATWPRAWQLEYREMVGRNEVGVPAVPGATERGGLPALMRRYEESRWLAAALPPHLAERLCTAAVGKAREAALGYALLVGLGEAAVGEMPEKYLGDAIRDLVMHEVGHTLGLRHNFKASSGIPYERLNDRAFTREHGLTLSVMDYGPVNVSPDRDRQGDYWNAEVGSYDVWAIRYGYTPFPGAGRAAAPADRGGAGSGGEVAPPSAGSGVARELFDPESERRWLQEIASEAADPFHAYNTDEDAALGSFAVDPLTSTWDLSSDPLRYAADRARVVAAVQPKLEERLIGRGEGYQRLRGAMTSLLFERFLSLLPVTKMVGGLYFARDHKGDPNGRLPFTPVAAERQREAVGFLVDQALKEGAFTFDPELLKRLAPNRYSHWGMPFVELPVDYPVHSYVLLVQRAILYELLSPPRLWRLIDGEARRTPGEDGYRAAELFATLTGAVWSELGFDAAGRVTGRARPVDSFRRNLQRVHSARLIELLLDRATGFPTASTPEDGRSLSRLELGKLSRRIGQVLRAGGADVMTRAHLEESKARIDRALEASLSVRE
ncbi:MAG: zinc-dependent metalloprotease [Gemmatimonadota bacterium]